MGRLHSTPDASGLGALGLSSWSVFCYRGLALSDPPQTPLPGLRGPPRGFGSLLKDARRVVVAHRSSSRGTTWSPNGISKCHLLAKRARDEIRRERLSKKKMNWRPDEVPRGTRVAEEIIRRRWP